MKRLTPADQETFRSDGIILLKNAAPKQACAAAKEAILRELDRLKLRVNGKPVSSKIQNLPVFQQTTVLGQKVRVGPELTPLFSADLMASLSVLAGVPLKGPHQPQLLLSFPQKQEWTLGRLNWHLDLAIPPKNELSGIQAFILVDDLKPQGGATMAIAGSHRLAYARGGAAQSALPILRDDKVFKGLFTDPPPSAEILRRPHGVDGVDVRVVEMHGSAGDVYLMDLRVLHSPSINATPRIRMMVTERFPI